MYKLDYEKVFWTLVSETKKYLLDNNLKAMILGISGGIDSTVTAAICYEVSKQTSIPLIGRSLPIKNKNDEFNTSKLAGEAFCNDFKVVNLIDSYNIMRETTCDNEDYHDTPISRGNIQARLRMIYLYNLASIHNGLVMSTDNQTEYQLGFWTIHGDVGDFDPLQDLWKTEVYELAKYIFNIYDSEARRIGAYLSPNAVYFVRKLDALKHSINLTPTDGLGISNSDLDQIGAKSYSEVDAILQDFLAFADDYMCKKDAIADYVEYNALYDIEPEVIEKVLNRHLNSEFKREHLPIYVKREKYES